MSDLAALNARWGGNEKVEFYLLDNAFPVMRVTQGPSQLDLSLYGGQVLSWIPSTQKVSVIYDNPQKMVKSGKAIRGGIPICWPWFGAHSVDRNFPSHGFARCNMWEIAAIEACDTETIVTLILPMTDTFYTAFPYACQATLTLRVGEALTLALTTENKSDKTFTLSNAIHTYFNVGNIEQTVIKGLDHCLYMDATDALKRQTQTGDLVVKEEVDRIYLETDNAFVIDDAENRRRICISHSGTRTAVLWNPWKDKSQAFADFPDDGYQKMVCVEAVNGFLDEVELAAGATHTLTQEIKVEPYTC